MNALAPRAGMVLAAGRGTRMGELSQTTPKPLVTVAGRTMLDRAIDSLVAGGCSHVVVNVHHLADQVEAQARARDDTAIGVSDERAALLDTGGGVKRALGLLGDDVFFTRNSDCFWIETTPGVLADLAAAWDPATMDALLLLAGRGRMVGHDGPGDFTRDAGGRLARRGAAASAPYVYAGAQIMKAALFSGVEETAFSLNRCWDRALTAGRLFGFVLDRDWFHVGDRNALALAEARLAETP